MYLSCLAIVIYSEVVVGSMVNDGNERAYESSCNKAGPHKENSSRGNSNIISNTLRGSKNCLTCREPESQTENVDASKHTLQESWLLIHTNLSDYIMEQRNDILDALQEEWTYTRNFWKDSDGELAKFQQRKQDTREETEQLVVGQ